jgi:RND superfamily putative drug exporter
VPERWTRAVLRARVAILAAWAVVLVLGLLASSSLSGLLANVFTVPGTGSDRARVVLERAFAERPDGVFVVVFRGEKRDRAAAARKLRAAARLVPTGHVSPLRNGQGVLYASIDSTLDLQRAKGYVERVREALRGPPRAWVTGQPAVQHDLEPILAQDLRRGEAIALPIALLVLVAVLGLSLAVLIPFLFAACTITATLGIVWLLAHEVTMVNYVTNLVELVGLGLAIDYSLLIVSRFREELDGVDGVDGAIVRTMETAGRAVMFSGATVAVGLALLLFVPVPFIRSLGVGGFLVPLVSLLAVATLQPALLSVLGTRVRARTFRSSGRFWERLAHVIMRRPAPFLVAGALLLVAAAVPSAWLDVTPGSIEALPRGPESMTGVRILRDQAGAGALTPTEIVVDASQDPAVKNAIDRLTDLTFQDHEAYITASGPSWPWVDKERRYRRVWVVGRHEYGDPESRALVGRIRDRYLGEARFPPGTRVYVGGAPPQAVDYLDRTYTWFPGLVVVALALTYVVLLRAFRSLLLPLKAVILNALSVAATYGMLVVLFRWGAGSIIGLQQADEIEAWIPIFLFAMLFGLSMDYEVFLVTRMREAWEETRDNTVAVARGLERTGRIVTAAALIMVGAFSGFMAGRVVGLQEFGAGLACAVLIDVTIVRAILVPSLMAVLGTWNWYRPGSGSRRSLSRSTRSVT